MGKGDDPNCQLASAPVMVLEPGSMPDLDQDSAERIALERWVIGIGSG